MVKLIHIYAYGKYDYDMKYPLNYLVVLHTSTQLERTSSKPPNYFKYEIKAKLHGNMLAGNHMKYYGDKERKDYKKIKQQLFNVFCASCHYKMIHLIDAV